MNTGSLSNLCSPDPDLSHRVGRLLLVPCLSVCSCLGATLACQAEGGRSPLIPGARKSIKGQQGETLARGYVRWDLRKASRSGREGLSYGIEPNYKQRDKEGRREWASAGKQRPRW